MDLSNINIEEDIILIDKSKDWTSFDVVAKVRNQLSKQYREQAGERKRIKVGHSGTLDPAATGLLVLAVGKATKKLTGLTKLGKVYEVEATLGFTSNTGDSEGEIKQVNKQESSTEEVESSLAQFIGDIEQIPPKYSAIKINGVRAYKMAREGKEFELKSRQVNIEYINSVEYQYPILKFTCKVSSGTYVRSLVEDIGKDLGCGAYMSNLRRTEIGEFNVNNAIRVDQ